MIVKIVRGEKMTGLLSYLQGPGKANEHTDPHLITGDPAIMAWHGEDELSHTAALEVARAVDKPYRHFGTKVTIPNYLRDAQGREMRDRAGKKVRDPIDPDRDANVWHCSLALRADEGRLTDEKWGQIAQSFMDRMGFTEASGRSPARWVAVHHGMSAAGNDHIHIAASAVREDGTKVDLYRDYKRASEAAHALEVEHGLTVIDSRSAQIGEPGFHRAEKHRAEREGAVELDRDLLARRVRACATASRDEAEFVRRMRGQGLIVRPRMAAGRADVVTGYKVALRPRERSTAPVFYGGGHLAKDLTLPRLRGEWADTPEQADAAVAEWNAARRGQKPVAPGRERKQVADPRMLDRAVKDLTAWNGYLASVPVSDRAQWARAAGRTAGVFAAWSHRLETTPGPLADAARQFSRSAQVPAHQQFRRKQGTLSAGGTALIVMQASPNLSQSVAYALLMRQLIKTTEAIAAAHRAAGDANRARELEALARTRLDAVHSRLDAVHARLDHTPDGPAPAAARAATTTLDPELAEAQRQRESDFPTAPKTSTPGSPIPTRLDPPARTAHTTGRGGDERGR
ncbi:relaxase/mobilization nuclease domain-containing protein [Rhodococcus rhodnii]|uniref:relaxase/mobilization nuclease domain-containing protein n=1 Tax=Rhodococcus rhodnii TaxID=38312 RepID=UPI00093431F1|nr:relaxase/mobilization nuclease domain-containing protein [Rhodococcus rhodnii]